MSNKNTNVFEHFKLHITPWDVAKGIGGCAVELFKMHLLSPVSDHHFEHPLDTPVEQVIPDNKWYAKIDLELPHEPKA